MDSEHRMWRLAPAIVIAGASAVVAVTLFKVPVASLVWLATVAICPLMMLGMHRLGQGGSTHGAGCHGHQQHEEHENHEEDRR